MHSRCDRTGTQILGGGGGVEKDQQVVKMLGKDSLVMPDADSARNLAESVILHSSQVLARIPLFTIGY